jgi:hypothetical protein
MKRMRVWRKREKELKKMRINMRIRKMRKSKKTKKKIMIISFMQTNRRR